jgi:hypothetical protein
MANNNQKVYTRGDRVEVFVDGNWIPAIVQNVSALSASNDNGSGAAYTLTPDMAGQPQFTGRPAQYYPPLRGVGSDSVREVGSKDDPSTKVDAYAFKNESANNSPGNFTNAQNLKNQGLDAESGAKRAEASLKDGGKTVEDATGIKGNTDTTVGAPFQQAVKSDADGNVNHGANASVELVGDVTGTNGTGSVNANGEAPAADPNTPVNQTPYTVEASNDPSLGLDKTNIPNTGAGPLTSGDQGVEPTVKTGNAAPVNPTQQDGKDGKIIASDKYDGALASATPVGSKDDKQTAAAKADDGEKNGVVDHKYPSIDNSALNSGKADPAAKADGTNGTTVAAAVKEAADKNAANAEKMTSDTDPLKPTKADADAVGEVHGATGDQNPQLPATDTQATDGSVNTVRSQPGIVTAKQDAAKDTPTGK